MLLVLHADVYIGIDPSITWRIFILPILPLSPCVLLYVLPTDQRFRRTTESRDQCLPINEGYISFLVPAIKSTKTEMA